MKNIEKEVLEFIIKIKRCFNKKFKDYVINVNYNNNGQDKSKYFSEIEIEIWKDDMEYIFSIILYINGKLQGSKEELIGDFLYDLHNNFILNTC